MAQKEMVPTPEAEARTGATRWALERARKNGALFAVRDNTRGWLWAVEDLDAWSAERTKMKPKKTTPAPKGDAVALAAALGEVEGLRVAVEALKRENDAATLNAARAWDQAARERERADSAEARAERERERADVFFERLGGMGKAPKPGLLKRLFKR